MKLMLFLCLFFLSNLGIAAPKIFTMVTSTKVELGQLFFSYEPVNYLDYGFPQQLAHTYSIRTTYKIPTGYLVRSSTRNTAPYTTCPYNQCTSYSGYKTETVTMRHPDLKMTWELIDEQTKKVIASQTSQLDLEFSHSAYMEQSIPLAGLDKKGTFKLLNQTAAQGIKLNIPNSYSADQVMILYAREFATQRLSEMRFDLKKPTLFDYELSGVNFTKEATKTIFKTQGAMLDFNRDRIGFYFGIAGANPKSPTLSEITISHD
jgi:hypothetical protein